MCAFIPAIVMSSCMKTDNYAEPDASLSGTVIDETTNKPILTGPGEFSIRLLETSWSDNPSPQDLAVRQDGSYQNTKLFQATYSMQPYGGAFWPADKVLDVKLGASGKQDFHVTPYLQVNDVKWTVSADHKMVISCTLEAPLVPGLPQVIEVRPFISLTPNCGAGNRIDAYFKDEYRVSINKEWAQIGNVSTGKGNETYTINDIPLKSGFTYYVRMGAKVKDTFEKYNYSAVQTVKIP